MTLINGVNCHKDVQIPGAAVFMGQVVKTDIPHLSLTED